MRPSYLNAGLGGGAAASQFVEHRGHVDEEGRHAKHLWKGNSTGDSGHQRLVLIEFTLMRFPVGFVCISDMVFITEPLQLQRESSIAVTVYLPYCHSGGAAGLIDASMRCSQASVQRKRQEDAAVDEQTQCDALMGAISQWLPGDDPCLPQESYTRRPQQHHTTAAFLSSMRSASRQFIRA